MKEEIGVSHPPPPPHPSFAPWLCGTGTVFLRATGQKLEVIIETYGRTSPLFSLALMMLGYFRRAWEGRFYHYLGSHQRTGGSSRLGQVLGSTN